MPDFKISNKAMEDLLDIARYTEKTWGAKQRQLYLKMLDLTFYALAEQPTNGLCCDDIRPGYLKKHAGNHVIFYRLSLASTVEVIRILHKRMDVSSHL
jgi:toxin ParE1/3/4